MWSYYPVPLSASPDATLVVARSRPEGANGDELIVIDPATGKIVRSLEWPDKLIHVLWRNNSMISFFTQERTNVRRLFIWDVKNGSATEVPIPVTYNQPHVFWAPDGSKLAFGRESKGVVVVTDRGHGGPVEYSGNIAIFTWSADSKDLALIPDDESHQILILDSSSGRVVRRTTTRLEGKIVDIAWQPRKNMLILFQNKDSSRSLVELEEGTGLERVLLHWKDDIRTPAWLSDHGGYVFQRLQNGAGDLFVGSDVGGAPQRLPLDGVADIRGISSDGKSIVALHRGETPSELLQVPLDGGVPRVLASANSSALPMARPEEVYISSFDGLKIPLLVWRSPFAKPNARAAVVRVHPTIHGAELPVWQEEIQMYLKHGVDFIGVNYRGSSGYGAAFEAAGNSEQRSRDLIAACDYAHSSLGVPYDRIVLLGNSNGSNLALGAALIQPDHIGILALPALAGMPERWRTYTGGKRGSMQVFAFHGENDRHLPARIAKQMIEAALGEDALSPTSEHWRILKDDDHFLHLDRSWAIVHSMILRRLGLMAQ
jgi:dipeptidyl aminopeptidase/acylaminoacyl peptidase